MTTELAEHEFPRATEIIDSCIEDLFKLRKLSEEKNAGAVIKGYRISINERLKEIE